MTQKIIRPHEQQLQHPRSYRQAMRTIAVLQQRLGEVTTSWHEQRSYISTVQRFLGIAVIPQLSERTRRYWPLPWKVCVVFKPAELLDLITALRGLLPAPSMAAVGGEAWEPPGEGEVCAACEEPIAPGDTAAKMLLETDARDLPGRYLHGHCSITVEPTDEQRDTQDAEGRDDEPSLIVTP